tara:strand:+ start:1986 stop:2516 length:531 start_codon:yes stop_codon:yes gene_type:complete
MDKLTIYLSSIVLEYSKLEDYKAFIYVKKCPGKQIHLSFKRNVFNKYYMVTKIFYKYVCNYEKELEVSNFGSIENILYTLIILSIDEFINSDNDLSFIISVTKRDLNPNLNSTVEYYYNKKGFNLEECPICTNSWIIKNPINLNCQHKICSECIFELLKVTDKCDLKCPVCRDPIF